MKRIHFLAILIFAAAQIWATGNAEESAPAKKADADGIIIYVGTTIFNYSLDPVKGGMSYGYPFTNCALLRVNPDSEYEGDMAEQWSVSDDALVYTFELKQGIMFSDGTEFTAEDVVFTYNTVKENQANNENADLTRLESVKATDDYTVEFTLSEPYSPFIDTVAMLGIVPGDGYDANTFDRYPIGTGPWKVVQYDPNQQIIVAPNENYYDGAPEIDRITIVYLDRDAALSAARSGQLDVVMVGANYASEQVAGMHIQPFETMDIRMISLPVRPEQTMTDGDGNEIAVGNNVTSDIAVRRALAVGIDREGIIQNAFNGVGRPAYGFTDNLVWANTDMDGDNQKDEARAILESSGWTDTDEDGIREKDGLKCEFEVYTASSDNERYLLAVAVAEDAEELGVSIVVKTATWDEISTLQHTSGIVWGWGQYNPTVLYSLFHSGMFFSGAYDNPAGCGNDEADALMDRALAAAGRDEAIALWKEAQTEVNADYPYLYIVNIEHCYFVSDGLDVSLDTQIPHPHGHGSPIICNMKNWMLK